MFPKTISPIQRNTIRIIIAIGILKIFMFFRDVTFVNFFGISRNIDIYFYALILPMFLFSLFSGNFNSFFIPTYLKVKNAYGKEKAVQYATLLFAYGGLVLLCAELFLGWVAPYGVEKINTRFFAGPEELNLFYSLSKLLSLFTFFYLSTVMLGSLFQAEHHYAYSFYPQLTIPLVTIIFILFGHEKYHVHAAAYGMIIGAILCFFISLRHALRAKLCTLRPKAFFISELKTRLDQLFFLVFAALSPGLITAIDQGMASRLGVGQLATLNYGYRIPDGLSEMIATGLGIAAFSHFSTWVVEKKTDEMTKATQRIILYATIFIAPLCFFFMLYAQPLIHILFERGEFTAVDTFNVSRLLSFYAPVIYFLVVGIIGARLISSLGKNHVILGIGAVNVTSKILFNLIFIRFWGLNGIPLATLMMYLISVTIIFNFLCRQKIVIFNKAFTQQWLWAWLLVSSVLGAMYFFYRLMTSAMPLIELMSGFISMGVLITAILWINKRFSLFHFRGIA